MIPLDIIKYKTYIPNLNLFRNYVANNLVVPLPGNGTTIIVTVRITIGECRH